MLLTSVILILQETLEAALLVSMLTVICIQGGRRLRWLFGALLAGAAMAFVYAGNLRQVSEWFDYAGQELVNAGLQLAIALVLLPLAWMAGASLADRPADREGEPGRPRQAWLFSVLCTAAMALAIAREGAEILTFLGGFIGQESLAQGVAAGSAIGFGIGVSVGALLLFALLPLRGPRGRWAPLLLLALFGGNMCAQAALYLVQADWLAAGPTLWDSSGWLPEQSIAGHLLYALIGYESNPSAAQVLSYLGGTLAVLAAAVLGQKRS